MINKRRKMINTIKAVLEKVEDKHLNKRQFILEIQSNLDVSERTAKEIFKVAEYELENDK